MEKLLGILPYIYFYEEPVQLGDVTFISVPDSQGRDHAPKADTDRQYLKELSTCFPITRGLITDKGVIKPITYFLLEGKKGEEDETLDVARKAVTLLRYALLRPDPQAVDNVESTYVHAFALPPEGKGDYRLYQCWPNLDVEKEIWISPEHERFPLPGWYVDLQLIHTSQLEDIEEIKQCFYGQGTVGKEDKMILAMEWYNQSFLKYTLRGIAGRLVDIATAFETLFQLPRHNKTAMFKKSIRQCLSAQEGTIVDNWAGDFYSKVRSETLHKGNPLSYLFKHPEAQFSHLGFLYSAQRIFRECVAVKAGLPRHISNERLFDELVPNEIHLESLKEAGSFKKILEDGLLREVEKLRPRYPTGKREDIVWLGKELLRGYKEQYMINGEQSLPTLDLILQAGSDDAGLGLKYYKFLEEFRLISPNSYIAVGCGEVGKEEAKKLKPITQANVGTVQLESAIHNFARFAGWAL